MFVYSGNCKQGLVGIPTGLVDDSGKHLFVGDIVIIYNLESDGRIGFSCPSLSAVVWPDNEDAAFVMGVKSCTLMTLEEHQKSVIDGSAPPSSWLVCRVKSHSEVVRNERWKDFGFSYKTE